MNAPEGAEALVAPGSEVAELDPRLERHRPALRYDSQEAFRAISAASITDNEGNVLLARDGAVRARAGQGLSLDFLSAYPPPLRPDAGDKLNQAPDPLRASQAFQTDPAYADRCYGRVKVDGDRTWLQYWLWFYDNPKNLLGFGRHEGDWELVQVGLGADDRPEVVTCSAHEGGEARDWDKVERLGAHPVIFVAPFSHASYFEAGAHPYLIGVDNPDGAIDHVLPRVEPFGDWVSWVGRWGNSTGVLSQFTGGGKLGGRSPASPGRQGQKWDDPSAWHRRALLATPFRKVGRGVRQVGRLTYPRLQRISARRVADGVQVEWALDRVPLHGARQLLVTVHPATREEELLASHAAAIRGRSGVVTVPLDDVPAGGLVARASAYNLLRQRSNPLEVPVAS
jgi:hypothetical protein